MFGGFEDCTNNYLDLFLWCYLLTKDGYRYGYPDSWDDKEVVFILAHSLSFLSHELHEVRLLTGLRLPWILPCNERGYVWSTSCSPIIIEFVVEKSNLSNKIQSSHSNVIGTLSWVGVESASIRCNVQRPLFLTGPTRSHKIFVIFFTSILKCKRSHGTVSRQE